MLLLWLPLAAAHGPTFGSSAVSVNRADTAEIWVLTDAWGLAHTATSGGTWEWLCEESIGTEHAYSLLAWGEGAAILGTREGVTVVDRSCGTTPVTGLPEATFVPTLAPYEDGYLALGVAADVSGVWLCDDAGCTATDLTGDGLFPKSARADGGRAWVTVVYEADLSAALWHTEDGATWSLVHAWPDGDTDPRVLAADGDNLLIWRRTRSEDDTPELLTSHDGGLSFRSVFETGSFTDSTPTLLVLPDQLLLGSDAGARTWRSLDAGETWADVSNDVPAVRCADVVNGVAWACGDHLQDGFDLARTTDGGTWFPVACLEQALPASCAEGTCAPLLSAFQAAGAYGGGRCDTIVTPPVPLPAPDPACGCAGDPSAGAWLGVWVVGLARRRYKPRIT